MDQEIKIQAEPKEEHTIEFRVDRPVCADASVRFSSREEAKGSPLAEDLFGIDNVAQVQVKTNVITVTTDDPVVDWMVIAKEVGAVIRSQLQSGTPPFSETAPIEPLIDNERLKEQVQTLLEAEINPYVASHGGNIEVLDVKDKTVYIKMSGGCQGCGMADVTLKQGVEKLILEKIPELEEILDTTDHGAGGNPYYAPSK